MINTYFRKTNYFQNKFGDVLALAAMPEKLETVNLGSTQFQFALDYRFGKGRGMNWALEAEPLEYDFKLLRCFYDRVVPDGRVLIGICPFSFFLRDLRNRKALLRYYFILPPSEIPGYSAWTKFCHVDYPVLGAGGKIFKLLKDSPRQEPLTTPKPPSGGVEGDALRRLRDWEKQFDLRVDDLEHLPERQLRHVDFNIAILRQMLEFCVAKNLRPAILIAPVAAALAQRLPPRFVKEYLLDPIRSANTVAAPVLNYLGDGRFQDRNIFIDALRLNAVGRAQFTRSVFKELDA